MLALCTIYNKDFIIFAKEIVICMYLLTWENICTILNKKYYRNHLYRGNPTYESNMHKNKNI